MKISGFESEISLRSLNSEKIKEIEEFVSSYKEELDEIKLAFVGTIYMKVNQFKFTPGHRSILLQIPDALEQKKRNCDVARSVAMEPKAVYSE